MVINRPMANLRRNSLYSALFSRAMRYSPPATRAIRSRDQHRPTRRRGHLPSRKPDSLQRTIRRVDVYLITSTLNGVCCVNTFTFVLNVSPKSRKIITHSGKHTFFSRSSNEKAHRAARAAAITNLGVWPCLSATR
jgi:hypothetical protein